MRDKNMPADQIMLPDDHPESSKEKIRVNPFENLQAKDEGPKRQSMWSNYGAGTSAGRRWKMMEEAAKAGGRALPLWSNYGRGAGAGRRWSLMEEAAKAAGRNL